MIWRLFFTFIVITLSSSPPITFGQDDIFLFESDHALSSVEFDPQGRKLMIGGIGGVIWDFTDNQETIELITQGARLRDVSVDSTGSILASASSRGEIQLWDVLTGELIETLYSDFNYSATSVAWSPTDSILASGHTDSFVRIWDVDSMALIMELPHEDIVNSVVFSPDGTILASGTGLIPYHGEDSVFSIQLWDINTGLQIMDIQTDIGAVLSVAFGPDGTIIASGNSDHTIAIWDVETGEQEASIEGHEGSVQSVGFSADGEYLVSASLDHTVRLWQVDTWLQLAVYSEHTKTVMDAAFSPDSMFIASVSIDKTAIIRPIGLAEAD